MMSYLRVANLISQKPHLVWQEIKLGREQHGFICGMTGGGKSKLAEYLVNDPDKPYSVVYDPKHSRTVSEWPNQTRIENWSELISSDANRIVYSPPIPELKDKQRQLDFFQWIFEQQHVRVYVDECTSLLGNTDPNFWFKLCLTQGRERGVSVVTTTQRPSWIPLITMSEATKFYIFKLNMPEDMERIRKITGITEDEQMRLGEHEFWYYDVTKGRSDKPLKLDLNHSGYQSLSEA